MANSIKQLPYWEIETDDFGIPAEKSVVHAPLRDAYHKIKIHENYCEDVEKQETPCTTDDDVKWCTSFQNCCVVGQKLNINLLYGPALPLLVMYLREMKKHVLTKTWTQIFIAALFELA